MTALTETRIEIANRHTTLYYLATKKPPKSPLPLGESQSYMDFYEKISQATRADYTELSAAGTGVILDKLFPAYRDTKYWRRYLDSAPDIRFVWSEALPVEATITRHLEVIAPDGFAAKVSPVPRVFLYPFGWSAWISLRITGEHTIEQLSTLVRWLFSERAFRLSGEPEVLTLRRCFDSIAAGVRTDAFGGKQAQDSEAQHAVVVTTILAKHGGSPALGALTVEQQQQLKRMVRPDGPPSNRPLKELVFGLRYESDLNYIVIDRLGRFIWLEDRLIPEDRNHQWLGCYHHNSFLSLVQAWHLQGLLSAGAGAKQKPGRLKELTAAARERLLNPRFTNASLKAFLQLEAVQKAVGAGGRG